MTRIVHYLNQFFAGIGAEEKADIPLAVVDGPLGPGVAIQNELKGAGKIVATIYAGDNYANEHSKDFIESATQYLRQIGPDVIIAGPAFGAGRYGLACGMLLKAAQEKLDIPGVTGLNLNNPAVEMYKKSIYIVPTAGSSVGMKKVLPAMTRLALRLGERVQIGPAREEGYLPRGIRRNVFMGENTAVRAVDTAIARVKGIPFHKEMEIVAFDTVPPPPPIKDLSKVTIALVTEGGIVPPGNPGRLETRKATKWFHYPLDNKNPKKGDLEAWHGGYISDWANEDPNRIVPFDAMDFFEESGMIGKLFNEYIVTTGNVGSISVMRQIGQQMADYLEKKQVDAVVLTGT